MNTRPKTFPVTKSFLPDRRRFDAYVDEIYSSNWLTNFGALHERLENRLQDYLGVKNLLLISNGTLALQIAYRALDIKGEVITTPFSFVATTSSLIWENLTPVFADIDRATLTMDVKAIEKKLTSKTSAILPVHIYGNVCDVDAIAELSRKHHLKVIYDAAHAFAINYDNQSVLNYGDASILSFHATKLFHTIEGGAIVFKDRAAYDRARRLINFGITGPDRVESLGINCKMNEFQAAMGLAMLDQMEDILQNRKRVFEYYLRELPGELIAPAMKRGVEIGLTSHCFLSRKRLLLR